MSSALFKLPTEVFGLNVLAMLSCVDVAHLDSAACSRSSRHDLDILFSMAQTDLRDLADQSRYCSSEIVWKWFWKRSIVIMGVTADFRKIGDINQHIHFVKPPLTIICDWSPSQASAASTGIAVRSAVIQKADSVLLKGRVRMNELADLIPRMTSLTSIEDESSNLTQDDITRLIHLSPKLTQLKVKANFGTGLLNAILPIGRTLRSLKICTRTLQEEHYRLIAQHCPHLTTFRLEEIVRGSLSRDGVAAIAKGCPQLQNVYVSDASNTETFLLLFAAHCPELRKVDFWTLCLANR